MKMVAMGNKKKVFKSIKLMAVETGIPYMTLYMRLRMGTKPVTAASKPVRKYNRKVEV